MNIVAINALKNGSPAEIMRGVLECAEIECNAKTVSFFSNWKSVSNEYKGSIRFGYKFENIVSYVLAKYLGLNGLCGLFGTISLTRQLKKLHPDVVHLHNLHLWSFNLPILMHYLKKSRVKVIWTLHDCWAFTGRCPHFQLTNCEKWKSGCHHCPYPSTDYPFARVDTSSFMWKLKKQMFNSLDNLVLVTPSYWLQQLVAKSFLSGHECMTIHNGIDMNVFRPSRSNFREKINAVGKIIVLGVSYAWNFSKGIDIFEQLANQLDDRFVIVIVGVDKINKDKLSDRIIKIERTQNRNELAEIYTAADVFVNPTRAEVLGMVNAEALACGTPVVCFNSGGCAEIINNEVGYVTKEKSVDEIICGIEKIIKMSDRLEEKCIERALQFDMKSTYKDYARLFQKVFNQ